MIKAYYEIIFAAGPCNPLQRRVQYDIFNTLRECKKQNKKKKILTLNWYFLVEKYDKKGNFIKKIKI